MENRTMVAVVALVTAVANIAFLFSGASHSLSCTLAQASTQLVASVHAAVSTTTSEGE